MIKIPPNSKIYYSYPDKLVFSIYGKVGELVDVIYARNILEYKKIEKKLYKYFFPNQAVAKPPTNYARKLIYQQFDKNNNLINEFTYNELLETSFSYENVRRSVRLGFCYKEFYWKARKNSNL